MSNNESNRDDIGTEREIPMPEHVKHSDATSASENSRSNDAAKESKEQGRQAMPAPTKEKEQGADSKTSNVIAQAEARSRNAESQVKSHSNNVESDEVFTAIERDKAGASRDSAGYHDKGNRLETNSSSETTAEKLVMIARSRGWDEIRVNGSETFKREAWIEATRQGMHVKGYVPTEADKDEVAKRSPEMAANRKMAKAFAESPEKAVHEYPQLAGAVAAVSALEKKAQADGLSEEQRKIVAARVRQNVTNSIERGQTPNIKLRDELELKRDSERERSR